MTPRISFSCTALLLAACGGSGENSDSVNALPEFNTYLESLQSLYNEEGPTDGATFPSTGSAIYSGAVFAGDVEAQTNRIYSAQIELDVNFGSDDINGRIYNIKTSFDGLDAPDGEILVDGFVDSLADNATFAFESSGVLTQGDVTALVEGEDNGNALFIGENVQAMTSLHNEVWSLNGGTYSGDVFLVPAQWILFEDE